MPRTTAANRLGIAMFAVVTAVAVAVAGFILLRHHGPASDEAVPGARIGGRTPGSLVSATWVHTIDPSVSRLHARVARLEYVSTDGNTGMRDVVSGTVFLPPGPPPHGGWRVIALGHGSTGVLRDCAPSLTTDLSGQAPQVANLLGLGYAVTMTDYQGLGMPGVHPYLDSRTAGYNVIDSVRALRATFRGVSDHWLGYGGSQGGGAVWSANEQAAVYAPELDLVGTIAVAPVTDATGLILKAFTGTLSAEQRAPLQWLLVSLGRLHPDLNLDNYRRGFAARRWTVLSSCVGSEGAERARITDKIGPTDLTPHTAAAAALLRNFVAAWALPQRRLTAPMLVIYGAKDTVIDPAWTLHALVEACRLGGDLEQHVDPNGTHAQLDPGDLPTWVAARFAGAPAINQCPKA